MRPCTVECQEQHYVREGLPLSRVAAWSQRSVAVIAGNGFVAPAAARGAPSTGFDSAGDAPPRGVSVPWQGGSS
jgi:hypothetical protein